MGEKDLKNLSNFIIQEGVPVSNGVTEGKALIVESSADFSKIQQQSTKVILIVKNFEPNFDILLEKTLGVVSEMGNMLCHLAIVSRVREIPAIIKAKNITSLVKENEKVTIDAYNGILYKGLHQKIIEKKFDFVKEFM
ncbi:MAG: PEP-utilizing enzyme [Promethearchaeia archaeon]